MGNKSRTEFCNTMGERELDLGDKELFDIRTADIVCLLDLNHSENLQGLGGNQVRRRVQIYLKKEKRNVHGSNGSEHGV